MTGQPTALSALPASGTVPRSNAYGRPYAVILVELDEIRFGDVLLDTLTGPLVVDEIVRRRRSPIAEFAEHRTTIGDQRALIAGRDTTERRRVIDHSVSALRIARDIDAFTPRAGHSSRVRSHNPVRRGCYVLNDGWRAECSCGWPGETPQIHGGKQSARRAWHEHKAQVITAASCDAHPGLALVAAAEREHALPPIPWMFAHNGVAVARLDALGLERGVQVAQAWATALGQPMERGGRGDVDTIHVAVPAQASTRARLAIDGFFPREDTAR